MQKGWHWYEPRNAQEDGDEHPQKTPAEIVESYKKELENKLAQAWIDPTQENIKAYQVMQKDMLDRSQVFSAIWMKTVFENPNLDHTLIAPTNQQARHIYLDQERSKLKKSIQELSKDYGLFFFFSSQCQYCHSFAPVVKKFSEEYGWDVLAISVDGKKLDLFPNAVSDNGLSEAWSVETLPALFAINPQTHQVIPIAYGMIAQDQIEERLTKLIERK